MILIPLLMGLVRWFSNRQVRPDDGRRDNYPRDYVRDDYLAVQPRPVARRRGRW